MSDEAILEMREYDWQCFGSQRTYVNRNQALLGDDESITLTRKFEGMYYTLERDVLSKRRESWIDEIDSNELAFAMKQLSKEEIELLTLSIMDKYNQEEIATIKGVSQSYISAKLLKIKRFLKKCGKKGVFVAYKMKG